MDYVTFRKEVINAGLLNRQYGYYAFKIFTTLAALCITAWLLFVVQNALLWALAVVGVAFWLMQVGLLGHDAGHHAIFDSKRWNDAFGHFFLTFLVGLSYSYWTDRHNKHHATPNDNDDPDFLVFALSEKMINSKRGVQKFVARRQHWLFLVYVSYFLFSLCGTGVMFVRRKAGFAKWVEFFLLGLHATFFIILPFFIFPFWNALIAGLAVRALWGIYFGSIVAVNHKGMDLAVGKDWGFVERQVMTTRDVRSGFVVDFVYGGLNYQIEHHLFPTMPRVNFRKCKPMVKRFCAENKLAYEELGVVASYRAVLGELRRIALSGNGAGVPVSVTAKSGEGA